MLKWVDKMRYLHDIMIVNRRIRYQFQLQTCAMGRSVGFETTSSNRSINQWWTQEAKLNLSKVYGKFNSLVHKANTAGVVLGQTGQHVAE